jgi:hypothetical protein
MICHHLQAFNILGGREPAGHQLSCWTETGIQSSIERLSRERNADSISSSSLDGSRLTSCILTYCFWRPKHTTLSKCCSVCSIRVRNLRLFGELWNNCEQEFPAMFSIAKKKLSFDVYSSKQQRVYEARTSEAIVGSWNWKVRIYCLVNIQLCVVTDRTQLCIDG